MDAKDFGQLLKEYPDMLDDSKKFASILRDVYPSEKGNVNLMILSHNADVVSMLRGSELDDLVVSRIMSRLMDDHFIAEDKARWAAELWRNAYSFYITGTLPQKKAPRKKAPRPPQAQPPKAVPTRQPRYSQPAAAKKKSNSVAAKKQLNTDLEKPVPKYLKVENGQVGYEVIGYNKRFVPKKGRVIIPAKINGKLVSKIANNAFKGCENLTSINLPDGITSIGDSAFYICSNLTSINLPDSITFIGDFAFYNCSNLTSINLPDGITYIRDSVFRYCSNLASINLPDGITSIGDSAFRGCSNLTSIILPDDITSIGDFAFYGCNNLTIHGSAGSYAEQYANENGIRHQPI